MLLKKYNICYALLLQKHPIRAPEKQVPSNLIMSWSSKCPWLMQRFIEKSKISFFLYLFLDYIWNYGCRLMFEFLLIIKVTDGRFWVNRNIYQVGKEHSSFNQGNLLRSSYSSPQPLSFWDSTVEGTVSHQMRGEWSIPIRNVG